MQVLDGILIKIKKMRTSVILMVALFFIFTGEVMAQKETKKSTIFIQTNAQCGDCKERLEGVLNYVKGISYAELHLEDKKLEVKYNSKRITEKEIKEIISKVGYDADDVKAVKSAQMELPACCQPGGHE